MPHGQYIASGFIYLNLGCHMMFVLKNRLKAQGIPIEKAIKIIADLIEAIFKPHFVKAVLGVQQPMSISTFKDIFRKLAHSSIMKLDNSSMQKLIFLIIMTVKKQFFLTSSPLEIYSITLGNLTILSQYVRQTQSGFALQKIINLFRQVASAYRFIQYHQLREYTLSILQPLQTKVVNFVQNKQQNQKGKLIFSRRNSHNQQPIGSGDCFSATQIKQNTTYLNLKSWKQWKTSLVMDHARQYQKQTQKRQAKIDKQASRKQKSINDLFGLQSENLSDFKVEIQFFDYEQKINNESKVTQASSKTYSNTSQLQNINIKSKINQQFNKIKQSNQEQQQDLLDMMDG